MGARDNLPVLEPKQHVTPRRRGVLRNAVHLLSDGLRASSGSRRLLFVLLLLISLAAFTATLAVAATGVLYSIF